MPPSNTTPTTAQNGATIVADNTELTSVPVMSEYFSDVTFHGAQAKMVRFRNRQPIPVDQQVQETNAQGVKKWKVALTVRTAAFGNRRGGDVYNLTVGLASNDNPDDLLYFGQRVELHGLWFGFMRQKDNGHVSIWQTVESITPERVPAAAKSDN